MICPNCNEPVEDGAQFCGNCGHKLGDTASKIVAKTSSNLVDKTDEGPVDLPEYSVPDVNQQSKHFKAFMAIVFGLVGIVGALFFPLVGLVLGVTGLVFATLSLRTVKKGLNIVGVVISLLALFTGIATWVYAVNHQNDLKQKAKSAVTAVNTAPVLTTSSVTTNCYYVKLTIKFNVENPVGTCNINIFNGATFNLSTDAYKVYASTSNVSAVEFIGLAKQAVEKDVKQSLPNFKITKEEAGTFAASPAYFVSSSNDQGVNVIEAAVFHQTTDGENLFVLVHASSSAAVNLNDLQLGWQWQ